MVKYQAEIQGYVQGGSTVNNKILKIKKAIMDAFPNANGVVVILDDDIMKITVVPCASAGENEYETILVEGRKAWKLVRSAGKD